MRRARRPLRSTFLCALWGAAGAPFAAPAHADEPVAEQPGEIIVVTGTRSETALDESAVATEVLDREDLEASGAETVAEALAQRPGLWLERGIAGTGVSIEGLDPEYVLVLVDGQRQIGRIGGAIDLDRLAIADVERIEIVRGPGSALYGADALGGVIHVIRRRPEQGVETSARIDGRLATDLRARVEGGRGAWTGALGAEHRRGDAFDRTPVDPSTTIPAYEDLHADGQGGWRDGDRWTIELGGDYLRRDLRGVDGTASGAVLDRRNLIEIASSRASARWSGDATAVRGLVGLGVYRDQYATDQRGSMALDRYEETVERLGETSLQVEHARGRHRATAGGEVLRETLDADRLAMPGARWRAAAFAQDEWHLGAGYRWLIVPAARVDHDSQFGTHATPRLAVRWDPVDRVVLRASAGAGYRAPSFKELLLRFENPGAGYVVEGNPDLRPERSVNVQLGTEWKPSAAVWLAASAYDNELADLITSVTLDDGDPIRFGYDNVGRARTQGLELAAELRRGRAALALGWAYTRARDRDLDRALEGMPAHRATIGLRWRDRDEALDASAEATLTGPRPFYVDEDPTWTSPRVEVRARIARRFGDHLAFFLGVENLLDAGDDRFDRIAPRTLYTGVEARR